MNWGWDPSCLGKLKSCRDNGAACAPGLGFGGALQTNPASRWLRAGGGSPKSSGSAADPAPARLGGLSMTRGSLPAHRCPCFPGEGGGFRAGFATPAELLGARGGDNNALPPKSHPPDPLKLGGQSCTSQRSSLSMLLPPRPKRVLWDLRMAFAVPPKNPFSRLIPSPKPCWELPPPRSRISGSVYPSATI